MRKKIDWRVCRKISFADKGIASKANTVTEAYNTDRQTPIITHFLHLLIICVWQLFCDNEREVFPSPGIMLVGQISLWKYLIIFERITCLTTPPYLSCPNWYLASVILSLRLCSAGITHLSMGFLKHQNLSLYSRNHNSVTACFCYILMHGNVLEAVYQEN